MPGQTQMFCLNQEIRLGFHLFQLKTITGQEMAKKAAEEQEAAGGEEEEGEEGDDEQPESQ